MHSAVRCIEWWCCTHVLHQNLALVSILHVEYVRLVRYFIYDACTILGRLSGGAGTTNLWWSGNVCIVQLYTVHRCRDKRCITIILSPRGTVLTLAPGSEQPHDNFNILIYIQWQGIKRINSDTDLKCGMYVLYKQV